MSTGHRSNRKSYVFCTPSPCVVIPTLKSGPCETLRLSAVLYRAHASGVAEQGRRSVSSGWDRLRRMPTALTLDVRDRRAEEPWAHARCGVFAIPPQPEHVCGLTAGGVAASALEQLEEPGQVVARGGADQQMHMRTEEAERHDRHALLDGDPAKEFVEKRTSGDVDHRPSRQRRPGQMDVDAVRWHGGRVGGATLRMQSQRAVNERTRAPLLFPL